MDFKLSSCKTLATFAQKKADALLLLLDSDSLQQLIQSEEDSAIIECVRAAHTAKDLREEGDHIRLYRPDFAKTTYFTVHIVPSGDSASAVQGAIAAALQANPASLGLWIATESTTHGDTLLRHAMRSAADSSYVFTTSKPTAKAKKLKKITVFSPQIADYKAAFAQESATIAGMALAKEMANRPANYATPSDLAAAAQALAKEHSSITCKVLQEKDVKKLKMGAFLSVSAGSDEPLRFIELHYNGAKKGTKKASDNSTAPTVLVGKGITFDSGGISLKPGAGMDEMKYDMGGAASVLGTFAALAQLQPAINVVGLIPSCENMPSGRATKPGDVVTAMDGTTIEVLNTDAEGRLILCDTLCYAKRFKPRAVIDMATLTGACIVALGRVRSGMFSNNDALAQELLQAGEAAHDLCWQLPLDKAYGKQLKSKYADLANIGGREAGTVTAAKFLQHFTDYTWAHLDIAGTAWKSGGQKGATGRPVPLLLQYLSEVAKS